MGWIDDSERRLGLAPQIEEVPEDASEVEVLEASATASAIASHLVDSIRADPLALVLDPSLADVVAAAQAVVDGHDRLVRALADLDDLP